MPSAIIRTTIAAGGSVDAMQNSQYQFVPFHAHVEFAFTTPLTGILATVYAGSDLLMQEGPVDLKAANQLPVYPDNFHLNDNLHAGAKISLTYRNTTGASADVLTIVRYNPLPGV